jgi:hypothetical protein
VMTVEKGEEPIEEHVVRNDLCGGVLPDTSAFQHVAFLDLFFCGLGLGSLSILFSGGLFQLRLEVIVSLWLLLPEWG